MILSPALGIYVRGLLRMSAVMSAEERELHLKKMSGVLVSLLTKEEKRHQKWLRMRMLKMYLVLPGQIKQLQAFQAEWHALTAVPVPAVPANYVGFCNHGRLYMRKVRIELFWRSRRRKWGREPIAGPPERRRTVRSPYFNDWQPSNPQHETGISADHSRGSADGGNTWLDRFLVASDELCRTDVRVRLHPQMVRLRGGAQEDLEPDLLTRLTALKAEYAAVHALSLWSPETRIPDPSRIGRDPDSKWFANGGTFVVWRSKREGYVPLSDPQGVQAELLWPGTHENDSGGAPYGVYRDILQQFGRLLVNLPGDFGDFEARVAAKVAALEAEIPRILQAAHVDTQTSPFHPASDKGAAAVQTPAAGGKKRR